MNDLIHQLKSRIVNTNSINYLDLNFMDNILNDHSTLNQNFI